ncbi:MAG: DUF3626 domain-containing protein [Mucilaginibacter sp.]|uniref:DUF3626 domain-containing protein n=1 Tax=Mucilaginibacter sp. TaxID=1882438 RepID=UPI0031A16E2F
MTSKEKQEVLARLAASETASLSSTNINATDFSDELAAMNRIHQVLGVPITQTDRVCQNMIRRIREADLTFNFTAYKFFNRMPSGKGLYNKFSESGVNQAYIAMRDEAEEKMFDYSNKGMRSGMQNMVNRISNLGSYSGGNNITFEPMSRPKYAALNYAGLRHGAAGQWGKSYAVLKENLKHNCTFIHSDSFDFGTRANTAGMLANYHNPYRLIVNMSENMLRALSIAVNGANFGADLQPSGVGQTTYIEAHVHAGIMFNRDIKKLCISNLEVSEAETKTRELSANDNSLRVINSRKLRDIFSKFAQKFGIPIEYI